MKIKHSPYGLVETFGYFKRNYLGPVAKNRGIVRYAPEICEVNSDISVTSRIAFIGDVMDMAGRSLRIGEKLKEFVAAADFLVGNFEATITDAKGPVMAQRHIPQILDALADLFPPEQTFLNFANNHSGDFGYKIWSESVRQIVDRGFRIFGTADLPAVDITEAIRVIGATQWTNQPIDYIIRLEDAESLCQPEKFNVLFPHFGYELELFPRHVTVERAKELSRLFDAVISHHSHIPQPITTHSVKKNSGLVTQVMAYGLGDFCIFDKLPHYHYGQVMRLAIGPDSEGVLKTGRLEWQFLKCSFVEESTLETEITSSFPYLTE